MMDFGFYETIITIWRLYRDCDNRSRIL